MVNFFFFQAEDGIRDVAVTGVQTCALPIYIRDRALIEELFRTQRFDLIVHCAAQPSHDKARDIPLLDFEINALGTVNLLEATRQHSPEAVFVFLSTNKVYGDAPNEIPLKELEKRYDYARA